MRIAYQGEPGAYSEAAALLYSPHSDTMPCKTFDEVFDAVAAKRATHGIVPMENSIGGTIHRNYDLLVDHEIPITGEVELDVVHCLQALPGTRIPDIRIVYSHPQALAQCERYLKELGASVEAVYDTAGGAKLVVEKKLAAFDAMDSQFFEGGCNLTAADQPQDAAGQAARRKKVREELSAHFGERAERFRSDLERRYGKARAAQVKSAEAFEICEYGRRPAEEEIRQLFPFFP